MFTSAGSALLTRRLFGWLPHATPEGARLSGALTVIELREGTGAAKARAYAWEARTKMNLIGGAQQYIGAVRHGLGGLSVTESLTSRSRWHCRQ